jgi:hypothetical protein
MGAFPDESTMPKSEDGSEIIRGGSIGFNRLLNKFVAGASSDKKPQFSAFVISAFTIFRNIYSMHKQPTMSDMEEGFVKDVNLFLEYYDTYLSLVLGTLSRNKQAPVIIYFPDYHDLPKEILRDSSEKHLTFLAMYKKFLGKHGNHTGQVKQLEFVKCFWIKAGGSTYPHKDVASKFREITNHPTSLYATGDSVGLISHIPLDWYLSFRIRNVQLLESYTGLTKHPRDFGLKLDKEGRIPFLPITHVIFGDGVLIKSWIGIKIRRDLLEQAEKERWSSRSNDDLLGKIVRKLNLPTSTFRKYDFI